MFLAKFSSVSAIFVQFAALEVLKVALRPWNLEVRANLAREELVHLAMTWDRRRLGGRPIDVHGVIASFAKELTAITFHVTNQIDPLHAAGSSNVSRITEAPSRDSSDIARFASRTRATASWRFSLASSRVDP